MAPVRGCWNLQQPGVQRLAAGTPLTAARRSVGSMSRLGQESPSVDRVPHERMADMRHMDADLVRPAGLQAGMSSSEATSPKRSFSA